MSFKAGDRVVAANDPQGREVMVIVRPGPSQEISGVNEGYIENIQQYIVRKDVDGQPVEFPFPAVNLRPAP